MGLRKLFFGWMKDCASVSPDRTQEMRVIGAIVTDVGLVRDHNEDVVVYQVSEETDGKVARGAVAMVADGMGGHAAGEVASALAAKTILDSYYRSSASVPKALSKAFAAANTAIRKKSARDPACQGMGTTCTVLVFYAGGATLGHIGDSRAYLLRDGELRQISTDHSWVAQMHRDGLITKEEMASHPDSNVLLKALGVSKRCEPDIWAEPMPLRIGDTFILCSDGLSDLVPDADIATIMAGKGPEKACAALRDAALQAGGHDNVSIGFFTVTPAVPPASSSGRITRPIDDELLEAVKE
jgi:protein phosphatase